MTAGGARRPIAPALFARLALLAWLLAWLLACDDARGARERGEPAAGTLIGRVRLAEGFGLPAYAPFDLARKPLHAGGPVDAPAGCAPALEHARRPVAATAERLLSGVVVAASDFTRHRARASKEHALEIRDCRLQPAVIAATAGDRLSLVNRDAFAFEPLIGPALLVEPLAQGRRRRSTLVPGVESVSCNRSAPCGRTDLVVFRHPVHAVSDARGEFRIPDFPAGELVRVSAWHPLFEEGETFVWVDPGGSANVELTVVPKQRFSSAAAPR